MIELRHIIEQKQELLTRESISRPALDYSEGMTAEEQKRYINYLAERVREADLGLRARDAVLQDFLDKQKEYDARLSKLDAVLSELQDLKNSLASEVKKRKAAERKVDDLKAKLKFANKNRFGDKMSGSKKKCSDAESDRTQDEENFDGTSSSLPDDSVANKKPEAPAAVAPKEKKPRDLSNPPDTYTNLKKAIHQVCMAHLKAKLDKALEQAGGVRALPFLRGVDFFYGREHQYDKDGLSPEERGKRRQDLESKEMLVTLRQHLKIELDKDPSETTPYLRAALKYLDKFWDNIFAFLKDGSLPIDNNLAERAIRPLTTQRNAMLHFGSDEGVEMAATYHSIISTVKMQGRSAWEYLGKFFTKIFNGCRDFFSMRPDKIGLAICQ